MKRWITPPVLVLAIITVGACQSSPRGGAAARTNADDGNGTVLFVQTARSGSMRPVEGGPPGTYTLTLDDPDARVVYFTDRPRRSTGTVPLDSFLAEWSNRADGFAGDPPNAALSAGDRVVVVELTDPVSDGSTLRYTANVLDHSTRFHHGAASSVAGGPVALAEPVLFIDNITNPYLADDPQDVLDDPMNQSDPAYGNPDAYQQSTELRNGWHWH